MTLGVHQPVGCEREATFFVPDMTVISLDEFGGPEQLHVATRPVPAPGPDQVLIAVRACAVCGHDLLARRGEIGTPLPAVLGHEIAGTVAQVGSDVRALRVGQRVALVQRIPCGACEQCQAGLTNLCRRGPGFYGDDVPGGYAEYVVASELNAVPLPDEISFETGAMLNCAVGTGLRALRAARLEEGDTVVVTGAGGGVGLHAVKLAAAFGYRVLAVSSSPDKHDLLRAAGALHVVAPAGRETLRDAVRTHMGVRGAVAAIENTGTPTFDAALTSLAPGGRLVLVGNTTPANLDINPGLLIVRELRVLGSAHATTADLEEIVRLVSEGRIDVQPAVTRPLAEAAEVHAALEQRRIAGRAVLTIGSD